MTWGWQGCRVGQGLERDRPVSEGVGRRAVRNWRGDTHLADLTLLQPLGHATCVQEEAIRNWSEVVALRLDLDAARGKLGPEAREEERRRFLRSIKVGGAGTPPRNPGSSVGMLMCILRIHMQSARLRINPL